MLQQELIRQIVSKILENAKPTKIILFGSQLREDAASTSDIDLALVGIDEDAVAKLRIILNEEVQTLKDIDLVAFDNISNENLKKRILTEGELIYERSSK